MNTHVEYRHHSHRPAEAEARIQDAETATSALAHHRDPSLTAGGNGPMPTAKGVAWVRPTELAAYAAPIVGRGIDLQAELIRRARRTPATTTRAIQRVFPQLASPPPPVSQTEGPSL